MARGLNTVTLIGTVSKYKTQEGRQRFLVTTVQTYTTQEGEKEHHNSNYVTVSAGMAAINEGDTVYVEGYFKTRTWTDKENRTRYITEIMATTLFPTQSDYHINRVLLMGRLGADPEMRYTPEGKAVTNMRLATGSKYTDRDGNEVDSTEWHRVACFHKQAENANQYLTKGQQALIVGRVNTREYVDTNGVRANATDITAVDIQYLSKAGESATTNGHAPQKPAPRATKPFAAVDDTNDGIPF